jgi:transcriptional regulator with XRE-family HTH domain
MTPFGKRLRELREQRSMNQKQLAQALHVSPAYLSALEHGHRSPPTFQFVLKVIGFFNIIWDEAEELQRLATLSNPRVTIDTSGLDPVATELTNLLAQRITELDQQTLAAMKDLLER